MSVEETQTVGQYDLIPKMAPFLDRHLVMPLLEFLSKKEHSMYDPAGLKQHLFDLVSKTNMVDYVVKVHADIHGEGAKTPEDLKNRRSEVVSQLKKLNAACKPLVVLLEDEELVARLRVDNKFTIEELAACDKKVTPEMVETLYTLAKFQFECGNYSSTAVNLHHYRALCDDASKVFKAQWGAFAAEILLMEWDNAKAELDLLKDAIEEGSANLQPIQVLQQRTWLIHWSLFVYFNHKDGRNGIIELFFPEKKRGEPVNDAYLRTLQTSCPWVLRYLTTAVVTSKRRRAILKELVTIIQQERYTYRDPITEFVECLYVNFDFEGAQTKLRECEEVLANDFFLVECRENFIENARLFIFETYCRIHQVIDIPMLAEKLNMDRTSAERWIVNLIRNARLDAKIDSERNHVIMGTQCPSVYQQVIQKTKNLSFQSHILQSNIEKREAELKK